MKNRLATIVLAVTIGITGLGLTSCGEPSVNANYTGDAVVTDTTYRTKTRRCTVTIAYPDGEQDRKRVAVGKLRASGRAGCHNIKDGAKAVLENGNIVSIEMSKK